MELEGGLVWLNFHSHQGVEIKASSYMFDEEEAFLEEDWAHLKHHAMPIGQITMNNSVNIFQINEFSYGISYFSILDNPINDIVMAAIVWVTTKVFHPFTLIPALKAILNSMAHLNPFISAQILKQIVMRMIMNDGRLNDIIEVEGNQIQLQSDIFPTDMSNIPMKFYR